MRIVKTEVASSEITVTLENGVTIHMASHPGRFHLHFSGIAQNTDNSDPRTYERTLRPDMIAANAVDIRYMSREDELAEEETGEKTNENLR